MKVATKRSAASARSRAAREKAKRSRLETLLDRVPLTRSQWLAAVAVAGVLLLGGGGYLAWNAYSNRVPAYEAQLRSNPEALRAYQVALVAAQSGRTAEAEEGFQRALGAVGDNALVYDALATFYLGRGEAQKALVTAENGITRAPGWPPLYYTLGLARYQVGRLDDAAQALERALELESDMPDAEMWLGNIYLIQAKMGGEGADPMKLTSAIEHFRRAVALDGNVAGYHSALAEGLYQRRDLTEARTAMERALELDEKNAKYWLSLGKICDQLDDLDGAQVAFTRSTERDPTNPEAHYGLGVVLFKRQEDAKAADALRKALKENQYHADAHEKLGQTLIRMGQQAEGEQELRAAEESRTRAKTIDEMRRASAMDPSNAELANNLGIELARQGDYDGAMESFHRALRANPKLIDARYQMAGVYASRNKPLEAIEAFTIVDKAQPGYRRTNFYLWQLNEKIGRTTEATRRQQMFEAQLARGEAQN